MVSPGKTLMGKLIGIIFCHYAAAGLMTARPFL